MATILLIDDSITVQTAAKLALSNHQKKYTLETVSDASKVMATAQQLLPALIIIDHSMPQQNGYELATELKKDPQFKSTPILLLMGPHMQLDTQKTMAIGISGAIQKPFTTKHLLDSIESTLGNISETKPTARVLKSKAAPAQKAYTAAAPNDAASVPLSGSMDRGEIEKVIRKVVEEIAWEVVPDLAESLIKEEISRLLKKS